MEHCHLLTHLWTDGELLQVLVSISTKFSCPMHSAPSIEHYVAAGFLAVKLHLGRENRGLGFMPLRSWFAWFRVCRAVQNLIAIPHLLDLITWKTRSLANTSHVEWSLKHVCWKHSRDSGCCWALDQVLHDAACAGGSSAPCSLPGSPVPGTRFSSCGLCSMFLGCDAMACCPAAADSPR